MESYFSKDTFKFLKQLKKNNDREWFQSHKAEYLEHLQAPAIELINDFRPLLRKLSPYFIADPKLVGGSLFRIYRDVRFSPDKSPYKTHVGIHFRHRSSIKGAHAPGFYLHIEPGECFAA